MTDRMIRAIDETEHFRFFAADSRQMTEEAQKIHQASPTATAAMGRLLTMTCFLSLDLDNEGDSVTCIIDGNGPIGRLISVTDKAYTARISCQNPEADLPDRSPGHLDVGGLVGKDGTLTLIRKSSAFKQPFAGTTRLVSGEIAEDFASYFFQSEQIPSIVSLGVLLGKDTRVAFSGGLFVQALPGASDKELGILEKDLQGILPMTKYLSQGLTLEEILKSAFPDFNIRVLEEGEPQYYCPCSKERMARALISLPLEDRRELATKDQGAEVVCEFCQKKYWIKGEDFYDPQELSQKKDQ